MSPEVRVCPRCHERTSNFTRQGQFCRLCTYQAAKEKMMVCPECRQVTTDFDDDDLVCRSCTKEAAAAYFAARDTKPTPRKKRCPRCKEETTNFTPNAGYCRPCSAEYQREYAARKKAERDREELENLRKVVRDAGL